MEYIKENLIKYQESNLTINELKNIFCILKYHIDCRKNNKTTNCIQLSYYKCPTCNIINTENLTVIEKLHDLIDHMFLNNEKISINVIYKKFISIYFPEGNESIFKLVDRNSLIDFTKDSSWAYHLWKHIDKKEIRWQDCTKVIIFAIKYDFYEYDTLYWNNIVCSKWYNYIKHMDMTALIYYHRENIIINDRKKQKIIDIYLEYKKNVYDFFYTQIYKDIAICIIQFFP